MQSGIDIETAEIEELEKAKLRAEIIASRAATQLALKPWWKRPAPNLAGFVGGVLAPVALATWSYMTGAWDIDARTERLDWRQERLQLESSVLEKATQDLRVEETALRVEVDRLKTILRLLEIGLTVEVGPGTCEISGTILKGEEAFPPPERVDFLIESMTQLGVTHLTVHDATDGFVQALASADFPTLVELYLGGTMRAYSREISDDALKAITQMPRLRSLLLQSYSITEAGVLGLSESLSLERVVVGYYSVSLQNAVDELNRILDSRYDM